MNIKNKGTGLLNASNREATTDNKKSDPKFDFFLERLKQSPELHHELMSMPQNKLVLFLIYEWSCKLYEKIHNEFEENKEITKLAHEFIIHSLQEKTSDEEKLQALATWESIMLKNVSNNGNRIAAIARVAGSTHVRIKESKKFRAFEEREANLEKGRSKGTQRQKEKAEEIKQLIKTINTDLLKHPDTARWTLDKRASHIEKKLTEFDKKQINGKQYKVSTIKKMITGKS